MRMIGDNEIHHSAIIGDRVTMGTGNFIGPNTIIVGDVSIGDDNWILAAAIGGPGEQRGEVLSPINCNSRGSVHIGSRNIIREFATIQAGVDVDSLAMATTMIGNDNYIMTKSHIGHDAILLNRINLASNAVLGGHTVVEDDAYIGLQAVVHQRLRVGEGAIVGMGSVVTKDVVPYSKTYGNPAKIRGVNTVKLDQVPGVEREVYLYNVEAAIEAQGGK